MFDQINVERLARSDLWRASKNIHSCRAIASALEIQGDGSEDVGQYVMDALQNWLRESQIRTHERRISELTNHSES